MRRSRSLLSPRALWLFSLALLIGCGSDASTDDEAPGPGVSGGTGGQSSGGKAGASGAGASGAAGGGGASGKGGSSGGGAAGAAGKGGSSGGGAAGASGAGASSGAGGAGASGAGGGGQGGAAGAGGQGGQAGGTAGAGQAGQAGQGGMSPCSSCKSGFVCKHDMCVPNLGTCKTYDDCPGDSYCDTDGTCVPYGVPPEKINDPGCKKEQVTEAVLPTVQCEWTGPGAGDPTKAFVEIYTAPMVADLNLDLDPKKLQPSIVVTTFDFAMAGRTGMLRVFDGRTCQEQMRIGGPDDPEASKNRPGYGSQWAIGDLDGDVGQPTGHPEIVGFHRIGLSASTDPLSVIAFGIDTSQPGKPKLVRRWTGRDCSKGDAVVQVLDNRANVAISIHDLDDDGKPEVLVDRLVFDAEGCVLNPGAPVDNIYQLGVINTVADVDLDGKPDLVRHDGVYGWDVAAKDWQIKPWAKPSAALTSGNVAVVDVGHFSELPGHPKTDPLPEIVVVGGGKVRVQTLSGDIVFGPLPVQGGGNGGPPTAADFDGDGQVEFATAGSHAYTVYDPDCLTNPTPDARPGGACERTPPNQGLPEGLLWSQGSQDESSNVTGSSVFDFNGDGKAEAVYRDECYLRVYEGKTGEVFYSAPASSGTGYEFPVIADVDGDFATEIVVTRTSGSSCPSPDPLNAMSGPWGASTGFAILRDANDRWASSRPIWNQHAYSITHVTDDARIPKSSEVKRNWEQQGLNNFRQNSQGSIGGLALADLTLEIQGAELICAEMTGEFTIEVKVCNRGTNPVQDGATIEYFSVAQGAPPVSQCTTTTDTLLAPGDCTLVACTVVLDGAADLAVTVDPQGKIADCHPGNNNGATAKQLCGKL